MDTKLSTILLESGFFPVLQTVDRMGLLGDNPVVGTGTPYTWDANNGVAVVYDERGWPWIILWNRDEIIAKVQKDFPDLCRGAWVPHSNDGGLFVRAILPPLLKGVQK